MDIIAGTYWTGNPVNFRIKLSVNNTNKKYGHAYINNTMEFFFADKNAGIAVVKDKQLCSKIEILTGHRMRIITGLRRHNDISDYFEKKFQKLNEEAKLDFERKVSEGTTFIITAGLGKSFKDPNEDIACLQIQFWN